MEYIYASMLLHKAGQKVDEANVKKVLEAAGVKIEEARVKALVSALDGVNILFFLCLFHFGFLNYSFNW